MKRMILFLAAVLFAQGANAQIVFDPAVFAATGNVNNSVQENVQNTMGIMNTNKQILDTNQKILETDRKILNTETKILQSQTKPRTDETSKMPSGPGMATTKGPSPSSLLRGSSLKDLSAEATRMAHIAKASLRTSEKMLSIFGAENDDVAKVDEIYSGGLFVMEGLMAIGEEISAGILAREAALAQASASSGSSQDIKGSMDQNTRMQVENTRAINDLIGVENYKLFSMTMQSREYLTRQSEVSRMLSYANANPFSGYSR